MVTRTQVAIDAAKVGADYAHDHFRTDLAIEEKSSNIDLVTRIDRETQRKIISRIREQFPDDEVVGEEENERKTVPESGYAWIIDPIDGTQNYIRGMKEWVTSVAVVKDMTPVAAINISPGIGETYIATKGGVERCGHPISVSETVAPESFLIASTLRLQTDDSAAIGSLTQKIIDQFGELRRIGSAQLTLSLVADGSLDATIGLNESPNPWDTVAGVHQIRQAGGTVTDIHGREWKPDYPGLIASNGRSHDNVLAAVQQSIEEIS